MTNEAKSKSAPRQELLQLPGLVAISLYLVLLAGVIVLGVLGHRYPVLFVLFSPLFLAAAAGLLFLLRWAWALALAAVVLLAGFNLWVFATAHIFPALVQGALNFVFFLYLIRTEVRGRLR
jgi:glycerol-3-phosphate acyltransferase PlsY